MSKETAAAAAALIVIMSDFSCTIFYLCTSFFQTRKARCNNHCPPSLLHHTHHIRLLASRSRSQRLIRRRRSRKKWTALKECALFKPHTQASCQQRFLSIFAELIHLFCTCNRNIFTHTNTQRHKTSRACFHARFTVIPLQEADQVTHRPFPARVARTIACCKASTVMADGFVSLFTCIRRRSLLLASLTSPHVQRILRRNCDVQLDARCVDLRLRTLVTRTQANIRMEMRQTSATNLKPKQ